MKLLIFGINYAPELTGIGKYTGEMAAYYAHQGHEVEVITAPPYYPKWAVAKTYRGKGWHTEILDGVAVHRCPLYVPSEVTGVKRILHEASFLLSSMRYWMPAYFRKFDAIVAVSPPFHLGFPALVHKWLRGTPVINHVQDLQVDAARDLGIINNESLLSILETMEKFLLRRMDRVSTISSGMTDKLVAKGLPEEKITFFPNWVDGTLVYPVSKTDSMRAEWGYGPDDKLVLYSGNLGEKQGLDLILDLADRFRDISNVHFLIIGEGGVKEKLVARATSMNLTRVTFKPLQPLEKLAACLAAADVHLVLQKKAAADLVLPSKLTNILAVGGHALITAEPGCTLYEVASEYRLGTLVAAEDLTALEGGLHAILERRVEGDAIGAKDYARRYLDKDRILESYLEQLEQLKTNE